MVGSDKITLVEAEMKKDNNCFAKQVELYKPEFIMHTACPFMQGMNLDQNKEEQNSYIKSTASLIDAAIECSSTKKIVFTGAATSVVGATPETEKDYVYSDALHWADPNSFTNPNEKAKILAERVCWNRISKYQNDQTGAPRLHLSTILPYFMVGPPLTKFISENNSSCKAISRIIHSKEETYPNVCLPTVDVRDVAWAHILSCFNPTL